MRAVFSGVVLWIWLLMRCKSMGKYRRFPEKGKALHDKNQKRLFWFFNKSDGDWCVISSGQGLPCPDGFTP